MKRAFPPLQDDTCHTRDPTAPGCAGGCRATGTCDSSKWDMLQQQVWHATAASV